MKLIKKYQYPSNPLYPQLIIYKSDNGYFIELNGKRIPVTPLNSTLKSESLWTFVDDYGHTYEPHLNIQSPTLEDNALLVLRIKDLEFAKKLYESKHPIQTSLMNAWKNVDNFNTKFLPGWGIGSGLADLTWGDSAGFNKIHQSLLPTSAVLMGGNPELAIATTSIFGTHALADMGKNGINKDNAEELALSALPEVWNNKYSLMSKLPVTKRLVETTMRTSPSVNPLPIITRSLKEMPLERKKRIFNYILFGKKEGVGYNTFTENPERMYKGSLDTDITKDFVPQEGYGDIIDAGIYGTTLDPRIAKLVGRGAKYLGEHENYVAENYPDLIDTMPVYETVNVPEHTRALSDSEYEEMIKLPHEHEEGGYTNNIYIGDNNFPSYDAAGHRYEKDIFENLEIKKELDIYKFNPIDYGKKWLDLDNRSEDASMSLDPYIQALKDNILLTGLKLVDATYHPIILRTPKVLKPKTIQFKNPKDFLNNEELKLNSGEFKIYKNMFF